MKALSHEQAAQISAALVHVDVLRAWGKLEEVKALCPPLSR